MVLNAHHTVFFEANADNNCRSIVVEDTARCQRLPSKTKPKCEFKGRKHYGVYLYILC